MGSMSFHTHTRAFLQTHQMHSSQHSNTVWLSDASCTGAWLTLMRKRIWKWTSERWHRLICHLLLPMCGCGCVYIAHSVFFHSPSIVSPWFWREECCVLLSPLASGPLCASEGAVLNMKDDTHLHRVFEEGDEWLTWPIYFHSDCELMEVPITALIAMFSLSWRIPGPLQAGSTHRAVKGSFQCIISVAQTNMSVWS